MYHPDSPESVKEDLETIDSPFQEYVYRPLKYRHIRLLNVTQDLEDSHIIDTSFESAPPYTAVSYTWNGESRDHHLLVDGSNIKITQNVKKALPHLIRSAKTQHLWIDGVCINQEDDEEKAIQVPLMKEIYTLSQECLVWLGESTAEAEIALNAIPRINGHLKLYDATRVWEMENIAVRSEGTLDSPLWKGLVYIFSRPWFKRVWTFQEGVLPPKVDFLCGSRVVTFEEVAYLANPLLDHLTALQHFYPNAGLYERRLFVGFLKVIRISRSRGESRPNLQKALETLRLLYFTRPWSLSNPLDRVYGVLGLTDPSLQNYLLVDYSKSPTDLSREIARWYIDAGEDLFILNLASSVKDKTTVLPSWIPNFTQIGSHWCIGVIWSRFRTGVGKQQSRGKSVFMLDNELHVDGILVDEVSQVVPSVSRNNKTKVERHQKIFKWEESCRDLSKSILSEPNDIVSEAYSTTMISAICDNHLTPSKSEYNLLKSFIKSIVHKEVLEPDVEERSQDLSLQIRRLFQTASMGHFFCTKHGRIGIGSSCTQPGDRICVFYGGFTPFIIRPIQESESRFQFVGDSYTSGLTEGEAFREGAQGRKGTFVLV